jgi:CheY-like chemotaxis protein
LPDGSGLELVAELAARDARERPRIIVMSASVLPHERSVALAAGVDGFLGKPYRPAELLEILARP